ncbi:CKLF-like MARVEL transmembrane domain-containing protein 8 [Clavelina lepadiformis]|uniref:CKLF-like MARVEL transmembrane domain-containing protein 8 n=1 Tax=Clavelina lepadiformis TaxID=159417 RepID=UPI0040427639
MEETTTTTTTVTSSTTVITCNTSYLLSVPGILKIAEVILGLLCWALIASVGGTAFSRPHQFVMFVAVTSWILTLITLVIYLSACHVHTCSGAPWSIIEFTFNAFWAFFYVIASCVSAAFTGSVPNLAAATAFAFFTSIAYVIHAIWSYKIWRGVLPWIRVSRDVTVSS